MVKIFAQSLSIGENTIKGPDGFKFNTIGDIFGKDTMTIIFGFAGFGLLLMIISAGFTLLTSAGDAKQLESGKQRLTYAIVGFLVIFVAYWVVQLAGKIFGVAEIQSVFK